MGVRSTDMINWWINVFEIYAISRQVSKRIKLSKFRLILGSTKFIKINPYSIFMRLKSLKTSISINFEPFLPISKNSEKCLKTLCFMQKGCSGPSSPLNKRPKFAKKIEDRIKSFGYSLRFSRATTRRHQKIDFSSKTTNFVADPPDPTFGPPTPKEHRRVLRTTQFLCV